MTAETAPSDPTQPLPGPRLCVVRPVPRYEPDPDGAVPTARADLRLVPPPPAPPRVVDAPPRPTDPALHRAATHLLTTVLEVLDRRRPAAHLAAVLAPGLHQRVAASLVVAHRGTRSPARLRAVHVQVTGSGAAEVFGRFERAGRSHAVAGRVERAGGRWTATALRLG